MALMPVGTCTSSSWTSIRARVGVVGPVDRLVLGHRGDPDRHAAVIGIAHAAVPPTCWQEYVSPSPSGSSLAPAPSPPLSRPSVSVVHGWQVCITLAA